MVCFGSRRLDGTPEQFINRRLDAMPQSHKPHPQNQPSSAAASCLLRLVLVVMLPQYFTVRLLIPAPVSIGTISLSKEYEQNMIIIMAHGHNVVLGITEVFALCRIIDL